MLQLAYPLDDTVEIDGMTYDIDLSFDNVLRLIDLISDKEIDDYTRVLIGTEMLLGVCFLYDNETKSKIFVELFENTVGKEDSKKQSVDLEGNPRPQSKIERTYSLKEDADYIFASFYQDYGIDLHEMHGKLHWLKFRALLSGLSEGSKFMRVIDIRTMELPTGKGTAKQASQVRKAKEQYVLEGDD